jgi:tetratricopeptide (TPR) repeat protein
MAITLDNLRKTVKKNKGKSQALAWLADMERASGDYEAALKIIDEALAASPSDVPAMLVRARILAGQQDFAGSVSEYKKVLAKDPFCLSAHKRMGEAYDQLGKTTERNMCFRRVHDMDPLDSFWKEEYDVLPEEQESDLAAPPMDDSSFTMDMDSESGNAEGEDNIFANLASSMPNSDEDDNASMDDLMKSLNSAADGSVDEGSVQDQSYEGNDVLSTSEVSSAITGILGGDDDLDSSEGQTSGANVSPFSAVNAAAVNAAPKSNDNLFSLDATPEAESQPTNVDDAFSSIFGDDDLPEEKPAESSDSLSDWSPSATPAASEEPLETPKDEDKATNVDDAFSSIFGDDDLPEEKPAESMDSLSDWSPSATPAASEEPLETVKEEDKATNVDDAFSSIFGDDDLPEEKTVETSPVETPSENADTLAEEPSGEDSFGGLFEKSADAEFSLDEPSADKPADDSNSVFNENAIPSSHMDFGDDEADSLETPKEEEKETNVDGAFSSIFGDDDAFEKKSAEEKPKLAEDDSFGGLFEKSADAEFSLDEKVSAPEPAPETLVADVSGDDNIAAPLSSESSEPETPQNEDFSAGVDGAFDELFEDEKSDDALVETPVESVTEIAEAAPAEEPQGNPLPVEDFSLNNDNLELPTESKDAPKEENLADEMGGAFASMFGNEDDLSLPDEKSDALADSTSETNVAEAPLSQEATSAAIEEDSVKDSVDGSFDSLFGDDDDLPEEKTESAPSEKIALTSATDMVVEQAESAEPVVEPEKTTETFAKAPSAELDSIDSEVSNAFKGLFDEDDSLAESDEPSNKGVDYLMSGDSDDEVAASLVNNADAPLSRGAADLDDSLNTRTLADIYMEQGVYNKALDIYADLVKKNPDNEEIKSRYDEIEKLCQEKFGEA